MRVFIDRVGTLAIMSERVGTRHSEQLLIEDCSRELGEELYENVPDALYLGVLTPQLVDIDWEEGTVTTRRRSVIVVWTEDAATYSRAFDIVMDHLKRENNGKEDSD